MKVQGSPKGAGKNFVIPSKEKNLDITTRLFFLRKVLPQGQGPGGPGTRLAKIGQNDDPPRGLFLGGWAPNPGPGGPPGTLPPPPGVAKKKPDHNANAQFKRRVKFAAET